MPKSDQYWSIRSDFIWQFLTPNIGVIPNPKTGCIFQIFDSIFPMKFFFLVCSFQSRPRHCAIGPFTGSCSKLDVCRDQIGALPILQFSKLCNNFQLKNFFFTVVKTGSFHFYRLLLIGRVVLDPAVHYLGPRGVGSSNNRHIMISSGLPLCFIR